MCRNIRVLHDFDPPTTDDEVRAAALQFVRKVSGLRAPSVADSAVFFRAVEDVAAATRALLRGLHPRREARTREGEREKARARGARREAARGATADPPQDSPTASESRNGSLNR